MPAPEILTPGTVRYKPDIMKVACAYYQLTTGEKNMERLFWESKHVLPEHFREDPPNTSVISLTSRLRNAYTFFNNVLDCLQMMSPDAIGEIRENLDAILARAMQYQDDAAENLPELAPAEDGGHSEEFRKILDSLDHVENPASLEAYKIMKKTRAILAK